MLAYVAFCYGGSYTDYYGPPSSQSGTPYNSYPTSPAYNSRAFVAAAPPVQQSLPASGSFFIEGNNSGQCPRTPSIIKPDLKRVIVLCFNCANVLFNVTGTFSNSLRRFYTI